MGATNRVCPSCQLNKTAKDGKRFKPRWHAIGRVVATAAAFAIVWTFLAAFRTRRPPGRKVELNG